MDPLKNFGPIWGASGLTNFFGKGYPYHKLWKLFGLNLTGITPVEKTTTVLSNVGNMPLKRSDGITPEELFPRCIFVSPRSFWYGGALNAVALSGPGLVSLISRGVWQKMTKPFFISIMAIGMTHGDKMREMEMFSRFLSNLLEEAPHLRDTIGLQINFSCPNLEGHEMKEMLESLVMEVEVSLNILAPLGVPLVPKINALLPVEKTLEIGEHPHCAGIAVSNTIPWDDLPKIGIDREKIFGSKISPLIKRGFAQPGGYSGAELLPLVGAYVKVLRKNGFKKHINAGGGILDPSGIDLLFSVGADSFSIGSIAFLRPWRTRATIRRAYELVH
jgi:dihydroorotate dehydrogenase